MTEDESVVIMMAGQVENADTISAFASEVIKLFL